MPSPEEIQPFRRVETAMDAETRRIMERAAKDIRARVRALDIKTGIGAQVRAAQLRLALAQIDRRLTGAFVGELLPAVQAGRKAAAKAADKATELLTAVAYAGLGEAAAETLVDGLNATAAAGIEADFRRIPRDLSSRVYKNNALSQGKVHDAIRAGLLQGLNAKELADSVYKYVSPTTPGGASYAAMRLSRTEINNAFHERQKAGGNRPGVKATKWNLSESHPKPDKCNEYADHKSPLGAGCYAFGDVPDKPHPHCFCFLTYVMMTPADFKGALAAGDFDAELDRRTKANLARLGVVEAVEDDAAKERKAKDKKWKGKPAPKTTLTPPQPPQLEAARFYDGWLAKVEIHYASKHDGKRIQEDGNWDVIQEFMDADEQNTDLLDSLQRLGYVDQALFDEAGEIAKALEKAKANVTSGVDHAKALEDYAVKLAKFRRDQADWREANNVTVKLAGMDAPAFSPRTNAEGRSWASEHFIIPTGPEKAAVREYTSESYGPWNTALRNSASARVPTGQWREFTADADAGVARASFPEDTFVLRGTDFGEFAFDDGTRTKALPPPDPRSLVGSVQTQHGYMSTSIAPHAAFPGQVHMQIRVPAGYSGAYVGDYSIHPADNEILLPRETDLYIHDVYEKTPGHWVVEAEVLPRDAKASDFAGLAPIPKAIKD
jgi:hypothetical protein